MVVDVSLAVREEIQAQMEEADHLRRQQVERARYEADCARRRYMHVDAANRLVAESLEAEWNQKLHALNEEQERYERQRARDREVLGEEHRRRLIQLTQDFPALWSDPQTSDLDRKRMLAFLIEDVTLMRDCDIVAHVRFRGGATATLTVPLPLNAWQIRKTPEEVLSQIDVLLDHHSERETVDILKQRGLRTGAGDPFTLTSLRWILYARGTQTHKQRLHNGGLLTAKELAEKLGGCETTINTWRCKGILHGYRCEKNKGWLYPSPDAAQQQTQQEAPTPSMKRDLLESVTNTAGGAV